MTKEAIKIERGIAMAEGFAPSGKYPWTRMDVGDSLRFGDGPKATAKARANARSATERHKPREFEAGFDETGTAHVWRTA